MRRAKRTWMRLAGAGAALAITTPLLVADSNVADPKKFAWGENVGHLNWADANGRTQGVEIYQTGATQYLAGYIWGENIGWIHVGDGNAPYANTDNTDYGINIDPTTGEMTGYAWGENVGWINFGPFSGGSTAPPATWDHANFRSTGYAWGENIGWINLDDAIEFICSVPGDFDFDGDVDVFDFAILGPNFGSVGNPPFTNGDADGDGDVDIFDFGLFAPNFGVLCP